MSQQQAIKYSYRDTEITYNEGEDLWRFTLRGRERSAKSLGKAKEAIDAPPAKEEKPFERIPCWFREYNTGFVQVQVTSLTERGWGGENAWITKPDKSRSRQSISTLYPVNDHNNKIVALLGEIDKERKKLEIRFQDLRDQLKCLEV